MTPASGSCRRNFACSNVHVLTFVAAEIFQQLSANGKDPSAELWPDFRREELVRSDSPRDAVISTQEKPSYA